MKIHSKSGCCGDKFLIETLNKAESSTNLEFSNAPRTPDNTQQKEFIIQYYKYGSSSKRQPRRRL